MMKMVDDEAYREGHKAFRNGRTLRSLFEPMVEAMNADYKSGDERRVAENRHNSLLLGFADAFIEKIRSR